jgi:SulP family sulfate permease
MTLTVLSPIAAPMSPEYISLAASLSLISAVLLLIFGFMRLGFLSQLLSRPVINGFIAGASILIVISQIKYILGVHTSSESFINLISTIFNESSSINRSTIFIGLGSLAALILARYGLVSLLSRIGIATTSAAFVVRIVPLIVILLGTSYVVRFDLDYPDGVATIGNVIEGLPGFKFFLPNYNSLHALILPALLMALIGMVQGISMAQMLAIKRRERIDANAELIGLGASNLVSAFYGGMPVGGGVSRSAVNVAAGAQTPLAGIVSAIAMIGVVAGAAHWFARIPLTVLAANIIVAALSMLDFKLLLAAWRYDRADALALIGTALGVFFLGLESGIMLGIGLSLATLLYRASIPHIAIIGRIQGTEHFRNIERHDVVTLPNVIFVRIDGSLFFGNLNAIEVRLTQEVAKNTNITELVLLMSAVNFIDTTGMEVLTEINRDMVNRGIRLHLAEIKGPVQDRLISSPLLQSLSGRVFMSINEAFEAFSISKSCEKSY